MVIPASSRYSVENLRDIPESPKQKRYRDLPVLIDLFMTFAKIGLFTFGGGYAMLSLIEDICVEKKKWISHDELILSHKNNRMIYRKNIQTPC